MAKFLPSEIIGSIRNKLGASVFSVNRGGPVIRAYTAHPRQPPSIFRDAQQAAVKAIMARWLTLLTEPQRIAWARAIVGMQRTDVLGQNYKLTGLNRFMAVNLALNTLGFGPIDAPPTQNEATDPGPLSLTADAVTQSLVLNFTSNLGLNEVPLIRATPPLSPGRTYFNGFYRVLALPGPFGPPTYFDLSAAWIARFGSIPQDSKIAVTLQYVNTVTGAMSQEQCANVLSSPQEVDAMLVKRITLAAVDMRALAGTPQMLLAAPGSGKAYFLHGTALVTHNTAVPFAGGSDMVIYPLVLTPVFWIATLLAADMLSALDIAIESVASQLPRVVRLPVQLDNQALWISVSGANFTGGDAGVTLTIYYSILDLT